MALDSLIVLMSDVPLRIYLLTAYCCYAGWSKSSWTDLVLFRIKLQ